MTDLLLILPKSLQNGEDTLTDLRMVGATPPTPYRTGEVDRKMVCRASSFFTGFCNTFGDCVAGGDQEDHRRPNRQKCYKNQ